MDEFCPSCGANIGVGTYSIMGCPLCGDKPEFDEEDDLDDLDNEMLDREAQRHRDADLEDEDYYINEEDDDDEDDYQSDPDDFDDINEDDDDWGTGNEW